MDTSTIAAIATPTGVGGIAIIRVSGPESWSIAQRVFQRSQNAAASHFQSHRLYHGYIIDPESRRTIDEILMVYMKKPYTYTREDVVEFHTHSGPAVTTSVLEIVLSIGARLAEPGEFTKRAFLNGRIDLTQAEGVIEIINAENRNSLDMAHQIATGKLKAAVLHALEISMELMTRVEAGIDFPDDADIIPQEEAAGFHAELKPLISGLVSNYAQQHFFRDGIQVAIIGKPNVGKSLLFNRLTGRQRAIVTEFPGTTRDAIESRIHIHGVPLELSDTAGIRDTADPIETIGVQKSKTYLQNADVVLFVVDISAAFSAEDHQIHDLVTHHEHLIVFNKSDLHADFSWSPLPEAWRRSTALRISALSGEGISELKSVLVHRVLKGPAQSCPDQIVPNLRQKLLLDECLQTLDRMAELNAISELDILALELKTLISHLNHIVGIQADFDVLDRIFNTFCIGK